MTDHFKPCFGFFFKKVSAFLLVYLFASQALAVDYYVRTDGPALRQPNGFAKFCATYPDDCGTSGRLTMISKAKWKDALLRINSNINNTVRYEAEPFRQDDWMAANGTGDCEDFAIRKRQELVRAGVPASSMRFAFVEDKVLGSHVVLIVHTDDGDRVLDNATNAINPANKTSYDWLSIQSRWNPAKWLRVIE